jgi:DNA-binding NarL/FixJ family response regulator
MGAEGGSRARIMIAGRHPVVRGAVRLACATVPELDVVEEVSEPADLPERCAEVRPDLLVLDADAEGKDGLAGLRAMRERGLDTPVLVLTDRTDGSAVLEALKLGVRGYLGKAEGLRSVGRSVQRVCAGERLVAPALEQAAILALGSYAKQAREGSAMQAALTPRERQILTLISEGCTMHQVGRRLSISPRTVETHVAKLYRKLGVHTRVQAVSKAAQLGLIELG